MPSIRTPRLKLAARAIALAEKTENAYSFDAYRKWENVARMLLRRGYTEQEAEAILRSKWTRWAADRARDNGKRHGDATSADLAAFLDEPRHFKKGLAAEIAELVAKTFPEEEEAPTRDETVAKIARTVLMIQTLETRNSDSRDFHEVAVWSVKSALEQAYEAGRAARGAR